MVPDHYAVVYTEDSRRIFVIISETLGDFVLTKDCSVSDCTCIGCTLFSASVLFDEEEFPILEREQAKRVGEKLVAYAFTDEGEVFLLSLKRELYKDYKGTLNKEKLDEIFRVPDAVLFIKKEADGTFTHTYVSPTVEGRVISKGCRAAPHCPCVGCRIVDMFYSERLGRYIPAVDIASAKVSSEGELVLPVFEGEEIISKMLNRDPSMRHGFPSGLFDNSPLEKTFYELAFLDLHLYPQHPVGKYRLDFAIPDKRIAIELDGHEYHKTKLQRTHDAKRDRWLFGQGWNVLRFTGSEIYKDLDRCIDEICELVGVERLNEL